MKTRSALGPVVWMLGCCAIPLAALRVWQLGPPALPESQALQPRFSEAPHALGWSRDGRFIVGAGPIMVGGKRRIALRFWEKSGQKFELARTVPLPWSESINTLQFVAGQARVLSVGGGVLRMWDAATGRCEKKMAPFTRDYWGRNHLVLSARLSPDGKTLACGETLSVLTGASRGRVTVRSWDGRAQVLGGGKMGLVRTLAWSDDGRTLAAGSMNGDVVTYEMPGGRVLRKWKATPSSGSTTMTFEDGRREVTMHHGEVRSLAFAPGTDVVMVATGERPLAARHARSGFPSFPPPPEMLNASGQLYVSPRGLVAHDAWLGVEVRDLNRPDRKQERDSHSLAILVGGPTHPLDSPVASSDSALAFSPDERQILARGSKGALVLWRVDA